MLDAIEQAYLTEEAFMEEYAKSKYRTKTTSEGEKAKWGRYFYRRLRHFHRAGTGWGWRFSEAQVIAFLRQLLAEGVPAWKRLMVVENLAWYRDEVLKSSEPGLEFAK